MTNPTSTGGAVVAFLTETRTGQEFDQIAGATLGAVRETLGGFFENRRARREDNVVATVAEAGEKLAARGGRTATPPEAEVDTIIHACSEIDDPSIQGLFANLLAAKFDGRTASLAHPSFGKVLAQMAGLDARLMKEMYSNIRSRPAGERRNVGWSFEGLASALDVLEEELVASAENLIRLGVLNRAGLLGEANTAAQASITPYGWLLAAVCLGEESVERYHYSEPQTG